MPVPPLAANLQRRSAEDNVALLAARNPSPLPSPTLIDPELVQVVTTTLYTSPTIIVAAPPTSTPIPVAAIAGGTVGGVALAIIAVLVWKWWGKSIMKRELEVRRKKNAARAAIAYRRRYTSGNTKDRTTTTTSDKPGATPAPILVREKSTSAKVSFAPPHTHANANRGSVDSTSSMGSEKKGNTTPTSLSLKSATSEHTIPTPSAPRPLGVTGTGLGSAENNNQNLNPNPNPKSRSMIERAAVMGFGKASKYQSHSPFRPSPLAQTVTGKRSPSGNGASPAPLASPVNASTKQTPSPLNEKTRTETAVLPELVSKPSPVARPPPVTRRQQSSDAGHNRTSKLSTVSSASIYSTPSGEERRPPGPNAGHPNRSGFLGLGNSRYSSMTVSSGSVYSKSSRDDGASTARWSWLLSQLPTSTATPGKGAAEGPSRLSAATSFASASSSAQLHVDDVPGVPIGLAIGDPGDLPAPVTAKCR